MKALDTIALLLVIIGAVNWGLIGFFNFNLVAALFGDMTTFSRIIYALVGIAGLYCLSLLGRDRTTDSDTTSDRNSNNQCTTK